MKLTPQQIEIIKKGQLDRIKELNKKIESDKLKAYL